MPYNPQISNNAGAPIGQGISTAIGRWIEFAGLLSRNASETKALRNELTTVEPAKKDQFKNMTREEMQGYAGAQLLKSQQAQGALSMALKQQQLQNAQATGRGNTAMSAAMQQAMTAGTGTNPMSPGQSGAPTDTATGMNTSALFRAMQENPESVNSPAGRAAITQFIKQSGQQPDNNGMVKWSVGDMSGVLENRTGKSFLDPATIEKVERARATGRGTQTPTQSDGPTLSKDGKYYLSGGNWHAVPGAAKSGKGNLFDDQSAPASNRYKNAQDVAADYKAGKLSRDDAAKILRDNKWAQ